MNQMKKHMRKSAKPNLIKDARRKTKATLLITHTSIPNADPHGDMKLRTVMFVLGYSQEAIDRVIEERQIKRANQADSSEG
jgi:hypothetical protein